MERRSFLKAIGIGASVSGACIPAAFKPRQIPESEMAKIFAQMDTGLAKISTYDMIDDFVKGSRASADDRTLCTKSLRTLYASQMFRSMPEEVQLHPEMQQRMFSHLGEMDEAVFGMTDMLSGLPHAQREGMRSHLRKDPELPERMSEAIDGRAGRLKMAVGRRLQMRTIFKQMGWRLRTQSPSVVIDEYVNKVEKVGSQVGSQAELQRRIAANMGGAYWRYQHRLAFADDPANGGALPTVSPATPGAPAPVAPGPEPRDPQVIGLTSSARNASLHGDCQTVAMLGKRVSELDPEYYLHVFAVDPMISGCVSGVSHTTTPPAMTPMVAPDHPTSSSGSKIMGTGGWLMGIGLVTGLGGIALIGISSNDPGGGSDTGVGIGLISVTVGSLLLIGGLITVIVGAVVKASE